jgi:hypothetical protein
MSLRAFDPDRPEPNADALYQLGEAAIWLAHTEQEKLAAVGLAGRLYVAKSGWLLLSVPNALVRGIYAALTATGAELPRAGALNVPHVDGEVLNAHISVMTADEVAKIGADKINERGRMFGYTLGQLKELTPRNVEGVSKLWVLQVTAPDLAALRKSYGLAGQLNEQPFHITVALRRKGVLQENNVSRFDAATGRGAAKQAAADETTYDCGCSGKCMCLPTCVCKRYCGRGTKTAADKLLGCEADNVPDRDFSAAKLFKSGQKDLLSGGEADNVPDRDFSAVALAEGAEHEYEHTDDDQIAKEIAKDHLSEDPAYYKKQEKIEKAGMSKMVRDLRQAKEHSDAKRYDQKRELLRRLMQKAPQDWEIDDDKPKYKGVTHKPTKFQFHTDPTAIPEGVRKKIAQSQSVYWDQLKNMVTNPRIVYDHTKPVFANIRNHMLELKQRGDWIMRSRRNEQIYRSQVDPQYRHQLALQAFEGRMPQPSSYVDQLIERYGDNFLNLGASK